MTANLLMILAAILLVLLNGLFVAAEFAFVKVRSTRLEVLAQSGHTRAKVALFGLNHLDAYLSVCQLGITLASLGLGWLGEPAVASLLRPLFEKFDLTGPIIHTISFAIAFSIITFAHVTFGELAPKTLAIRSAEPTALLLAVPMRIFYTLFLPAVKILNSTANLFLKIIGAGKLPEEGAHSPEELKMLITEAKKSGHIDDDDERYLTNIFNLGKRQAKDVMVHRIRVKALPLQATVGEVIEIITQNGHTRVPIYGQNKDDMVGFIHAKDLLGLHAGDPIEPLVRRPLYILDHWPIDDILRRMQTERLELGLVLDEYGGWQGLVTMEDIIEAIVGEIQDEFDHEEPMITTQSDGSLVVVSTISLDELRSATGLVFDGPDHDDYYKTLAALLTERLEAVPETGESVELYGHRFTVVKTVDHTISKIKIEPLEKVEEESPNTP